MSPRPARWWYAVPPVLLLVFLCCGGLVAGRTTVSGEREARPVAGPGDSVHFVLEPGVTFTVYQKAPAREAGSNCDLAPDGGDAEGLGAGSGTHYTEALRHRPERVRAGGATFNYGMQVSDRKQVGLTISCKGGPILVERGFERAWINIAVTALAAVLALAGLVVIAILRRSPARLGR
ncbi:hypothetical protein [Dactylosporangium sp. CA-233914]|uniref:hypothetical protein n=1 Tax=Dactylosporangium sp. CA-233914 TaxID=3239934 RepID=UPI003D8A4E44